MPSSNPRVLLVEGQDDKHVVLHLCERVEFEPQFSIKDKGGVETLLAGLPVEINAPGLETVGILLDADTSFDDRSRAVANRLQNAGITLPALQPGPEGTIINGNPRIGIWLMPNNQATGDLEDFVAAMIPNDDPVWPLSRAYVGSIPKGHRKFTDHKALRAKVHAWLATREDPRQMGLAIKAQDLDISATQTQAFLRWLTNLFGQAAVGAG